VPRSRFARDLSAPDNRIVGGGSRDGGLRIVFDPAIDGAAWPGAPGEPRACFGEAWLGPLGLVARLETELGLGAKQATSTERVADLTRNLAGLDGFWSASFARDPLATSARLLADRDTLALWDWRGEAVSPRLADLWRATSDALPGLPDRLWRILEVVGRRYVDIQSIRVADPVESLPPPWIRTFEVLAALGVSLETAPIAEAASAGDLAAARRPGFTPAADGSLTLLRPHGPLAAADEVAAALAALDSLDGVVLVGPDAILDDALGRHGLPRVGADRAPPASSAFVRLVVETAFAPMDPADLHGLLCAEPGPVPRGIARLLASALRALPGRGSPAWREALARGISEVEESRRSSVAERLSALLVPRKGAGHQKSEGRDLLGHGENRTSEIQAGGYRGGARRTGAPDKAGADQSGPRVPGATHLGVRRGAPERGGGSSASLQRTHRWQVAVAVHQAPAGRSLR